jgi:3-phosphoshikimate 1-carboxyvinyltransferase
MTSNRSTPMPSACSLWRPGIRNVLEIVGMALPDPLEIPLVTRPVEARVSLPGSKSYTNRALPIAALASGTSQLRGVLDSDDTRYMVAALQQLGLTLEADWATQEILLHGCAGNLPQTGADLFVGNSGTSMRFLTALACVGHATVTLDGTPRMRQRPLAPLIDGLRSLGVDIAAVHGNGCPPVRVRANGLPGGTLRMPGNLSSQYFSAVAMVLPHARERLEVEVEGDLVSKPYLDMTAATMDAFGVPLYHDEYRRIWVEPDRQYTGRTYDIEPDASAASYFFALAAVSGGSITVERLPSTSRQGDLQFIDVLQRMGCTVVRGTDAITVHGGPTLHGVSVDMNAISDTVQTLAAIAPFATGPVHVHNVSHIRLKETDRLAAVARELRRLGIRVEEAEDALTIHPGQPRPAVVETYDDHRMAMSFAITGTRTPGLRIADPGCVAKTVPGFWDLLFPLLDAEPLR